MTDKKDLKVKSYLFLPSYLSLCERKKEFSYVKKLGKFQRSKNQTKVENVVLFSILLYLYRINGYIPYLINFLDLEGFSKEEQVVPNDNIFKILFLVVENLTELTFDDFSRKLEGVIFKDHLYERKNISDHSGFDLIHHHLVLYEEEKDFEDLLSKLKKGGHEKFMSVPRFIIGIKKDGSEIKFYCTREIMEEDRETETCIDKFFGHIEVLLRSIERNSGLKLPYHHILTQAEYEYQYKHLVMKNFHEELMKKSYTTVGTELERVAVEFKDRIALEMNGETMTYDALNRRVNQVSRYLKEVVGLKRGDFVCQVIEKSFECVIFFYATSKLGCVFFAQDHTYPREKKKYTLEETKCKTVLLSSKYIEYYKQFLSSGIITNLIEIEKIRGEIDTMDEDNIIVDPKVEPDDPLYIFFTSGSTGVPKGILGEHLHNFTYMFSNMFYLQQNLELKDYLLFHKPVFVSFLLDMFIPILAGATMRIIPPKIRYDPEGLMKYLDERKIAFIDIPPTVLRFFPRDRASLPALTHVTYGGEALDEETRAYWMDECGVRLGNSYGMSENIGTHLHFLEKGQSTCHLGPAMTNYYNYVLDEFQQPVPIGCTGELYVGNFGIQNVADAEEKYLKTKRKKFTFGQSSTGYLNNEELTKKIYIEDRFNPQLRTRMIKTGDLVRMYHQNEGHLIYLGRKCNDVRISGIRIQLDRVEGVLKKHELVKDCVLIPVQETSSSSCSNIINTTKLIPFLLLEEETTTSTITKDEELEKKEMIIGRMLTQYLKESKYVLDLAIPKEYVILKKYPLNFAGKISWKKMISNFEERKKLRNKKREGKLRKTRQEVIHELDLALRKIVKEYIIKMMKSTRESRDNKMMIIKNLSKEKSKFFKKDASLLRRKCHISSGSDELGISDNSITIFIDQEIMKFRTVCKDLISNKEDDDEEIEGED